MMPPEPPFKKMHLPALFLVWGAPQGSHRSQLIARHLGMDLQFIYLTARQGKYYAPFKYFYQFFATLVFLARHRYRVIFVQDPPIFAVLPVYLYSLVSGAQFFIDSHTDALQASWWRWTLPLHRFLERRAVTTVVTNDALRQLVESWGNRSFTLPDPPLIGIGEEGEPASLPGSHFKIVMISTADYDEPVAEVVAAAASLPDVDFYITGDFAHSLHHHGIQDQAPANVHFTGYLREGYFALLKAADAILCLTTEDNTFLSGDNEALWLGKPLITSQWPILQHYFSRGTLYVDNSTDQIRQSIQELRDHYDDYRAEMLALQEERRQAWWARVDELLHLLARN